MIVLDAFALVALAFDERAADEVDALLRGGEAAIPSVNLAEAVDVCERAKGLERGDVRDVFEPLLGDTLRVLAPGEREAWEAARVRRRYYDRKTAALSLADCFLLAAGVGGNTIATADPAIAEVARNETVRLIALPDSGGRRP